MGRPAPALITLIATVVSIALAVMSVSYDLPTDARLILIGVHILLVAQIVIVIRHNISSHR